MLPDVHLRRAGGRGRALAPRGLRHQLRFQQAQGVPAVRWIHDTGGCCFILCVGVCARVSQCKPGAHGGFSDACLLRIFFFRAMTLRCCRWRATNWPSCNVGTTANGVVFCTEMISTVSSARAVSATAAMLLSCRVHAVCGGSRLCFA